MTEHTEVVTKQFREDEWLWGWDPTPGIVSLWAENNGRVLVWRRPPDTRQLVCEQDRFRPWLLLSRLDDLERLGARPRDDHDRGASRCDASAWRALRPRSRPRGTWRTGSGIASGGAIPRR